MHSQGAHKIEQSPQVTTSTTRSFIIPVSDPNALSIITGALQQQQQQQQQLLMKSPEGVKKEPSSPGAPKTFLSLMSTPDKSSAWTVQQQFGLPTSYSPSPGQSTSTSILTTTATPNASSITLSDTVGGGGGDVSDAKRLKLSDETL